MRDPDRLNSFYENIKNIHKNNIPDWRFMQLMFNFLSWHVSKYKTDGFYIEEEECLKRFELFIKEMKGQKYVK